MSKLELANSDFLYWCKKYQSKPTAYHRGEMINARDRLQRVQWENQRKSVVRQ